MKKIGLILAACLVSIGLHGAYADDSGDIARAAVRRASADAGTNAVRQKSPATSTRTAPITTNTATNVRNRTTSRAAPTVTERPRTTTRPTNVVSRNATNTVTSRPTTNSGTRGTTTRTTTARTTARVATSGDVTREDILSRDYSKCKKVFFECMDEFCANKDAQLKRCACSSRIHEFDSVKKQLAAVEEKMLDFNQRLLTVSMEKEDAAALNVATEGETAYLATKDKSDSKKQLDAIAKKLNTSFDSSNFNSDLNVLSWSLNADSAFDNVNSLMGASTTTKSGTALYSAALPVCREMALEVCTDSDLAIAESGYQATIEQDCNTVAKTYKTQTDQARAQVLESGALLDMSRLNVYQKRNSDDILTCKKKMLDMLTNSTVCGDELGKCLDVTGQYIDPSTGQAFLTPNLINLGTLLTRPTGDSTWTKASGNAIFVSFLNSKKKFLEPAMEQCQDIADDVWDAFVEDALSQIKLAQDKKLESVRQSCTTLSAQCLSDAAESITNFDARALSTFGISADITAQAMCANVLNTCTALLETTGGTEWTTGMAEIATTNTYETMMQTCRQVGRACIIQVCTSTSGNFGLCESIANSTNRKSIVNHTACWDQVQDCIRSAGEQAISNIISQLGVADDKSLNFYSTLYENVKTTQTTEGYSDSSCVSSSNDDMHCVYDLCATECGDNGSLFDCRVCRLAENIWGNCEVAPTTKLSVTGSHNKIMVPSDTNNPTLLYWFAQNTGTQDAADSCRDTTCGVGYTAVEQNGLIYCYDSSKMCYAGATDASKNACYTKIEPYGGAKCQCCSTDSTDGTHCCDNGITTDDRVAYCAVTNNSQTPQVITQPFNCDDDGDAECVLICVNGSMDSAAAQPTCNGNLVLYNSDTKHYSSPTGTIAVTEQFMSTIDDDTGVTCTYNDNGTWTTDNNEECQQPTHWSVKFNN